MGNKLGTVISVVFDGFLVWDAMYYKSPPPPLPSFFRFQFSLVSFHQEGYSGKGVGPGDNFFRPFQTKLNRYKKNAKKKINLPRCFPKGMKVKEKN